MKKSRKNIKKNKRISTKSKMSGGMKLNFYRSSSLGMSNRPDRVTVTLDVIPTDSIYSIKSKIIDIFGEKEREESQNIYILEFNNNELLDTNTIADYDDIHENSDIMINERPSVPTDIENVWKRYLTLRRETRTLQQEIKQKEQEIDIVAKEISKMRANLGYDE